MEAHGADGGLKEFFVTLGKYFKTSFSNKTFIGIWIMFYINITCGLALISQEKMIFKAIGLSVGVAATLASVTAIANAAGRLGFSAWADFFKDRNTIYKIIFILSILFTGVTVITQGIVKGAGVPVLAIICVGLLIMVNAGYGGGFSNVPTLLSDHFGMKQISAVHGMCLSAWAIAGLTGNQMATAIVNRVGEFKEITLSDGSTASVNPVGYQTVLYVTLALYIVAFIVCNIMIPKLNNKAKKEEA